MKTLSIARASLPALTGLLALLAPGCGTAAGEALPAVPPSIDLAALQALVQPAAGEKAVLVNFWATWCPPCIAEMPTLVEVYEEHAGGNVRVVTVALDIAMPQQRSKVKTAEAVGKFAKRREFELPIVVYEDDPRELLQAFGMRGAIPVTIVFGADGEVARHEGSGKRKHFDKLIQKALDS